MVKLSCMDVTGHTTLVARNLYCMVIEGTMVTGWDSVAFDTIITSFSVTEGKVKQEVKHLHKKCSRKIHNKSAANSAQFTFYCGYPTPLITSLSSLEHQIGLMKCSRNWAKDWDYKDMCTRLIFGHRKSLIWLLAFSVLKKKNV